MGKFNFIFASILCVIFLFIEIDNVLSCGGGSSSCSWTTCRTVWNSWGPTPSTGTCRWQSRTPRHIRETKSQGSGCPATTTCSTSTQVRYYCSCRQIDYCWWAGWGSWSGSISPHTCGTQRRYRSALKRFSYTYRNMNCNGVKKDCDRSTDDDSRRWCNCRKAARCTPTNWSNWAGSVPNGECKTQTSYRDFTPTYEYITKLNSCDGVGPSSCRSREHNQRMYCMCPYKSCSEGGWTVWALMTSWTGKCPKEERFKHWVATTRYKGANVNCNAIGPQSCQTSERQERVKAVKCPKLSPPQKGQLIGQECDGDHSSCNAICQMRCNSGYQLTGSPYVECKGNEKWSGNLGQCQDITEPTIACPTVKDFFPNQANQNFGVIDLPDATAADNSGVVPTVTKSQVSPVTVLVNRPVNVIYTATDEAANKRTCRITITVKDTEPPKVTYCPDDMIITTEKLPHPVIWKEPQFQDNVDGVYVDKIPSHFNGQAFTKGKHYIKYIGKDKAHNNVSCEFSLQISMAKCPLFSPPKHGASVCNVKKAGVEEVYVCSVSCQKDYWFVQGQQMPKAYDYIVCGDDGAWRGQDQFPSQGFFTPIPKTSRPWPDCGAGGPPSEVTKPFKVLAGDCKNQAAMDKLKQDFITAMTNDVIINQIFCSLNNQHCTVENVEITCASRRKRSTGQMSNMMEISFNVVVKDGSPSKDQNIEIAKLGKIMRDMVNLPTSVQRMAPSALQTTAANVQVTTNSPKFACEAGKVFEVVKGSGSELDRSKCVKCPPGTRYDSARKHCVVCSLGTFQDDEGQLVCKQCPHGYSTHGFHATNFTECKQICTPGTHSRTGLATCLACARGTYQPGSNSTSCLTCPSGKGTKTEGAVALSDCIMGAIQVFIRSEGCDDQGIYGKCGRAYIKVNDVDKSPHGRGFNLVVVNDKTGQVESTRSFDTHGRSYAARSMLDFVNGIADGKIVLIGIQDEGAMRMTAEGARALLALGGSEPLQREYRGSYVLIGHKGSHGVTWVQQKLKPRHRGPTEVSVVIPLH